MRLRVSFLDVRSVWTLLAATSVRGAGIALALAVADPAVAQERWVGVGLTTGTRSFASPLKLDTELALGARVSIGVSDRVTVSIDGGHSNPSRRSSGVSSSVGEVRVLTAYSFLHGSIRPYLLAGLGGQFFNFHDAPGSAGACVVGGLGAEFMANDEWALFGEGSVDAYRARFQTFSETGELVYSSDILTYGTGIVTLGLQYRF
jgi:hypothetical protein